MVTVEDCIPGNSALHDRFFAATEILARLVSSAPRATGMAQLEDAVGRPGKESTKLGIALSMFSSTRTLRAPRLEDEYNFAISGREASFSPAQFPA